ncbi:MAG: DsbA family protein, partial [Candidatus Levyibacteriota bacterium]
FKEFPLKSVHPNAMAAAVAAEAAGKQGKFWEYHNLLYAKQDEWSNLPDPTDQFVAYAVSLKLDPVRFKADLSDKTLSAKIDAEENEGINIGVNSTPSVFINGVIQENRDYGSLKKELDKLLSSQ